MSGPELACAGCSEQRPLVGWLSYGSMRGRACARCAHVIRQDVSQGDAVPVRVHTFAEGETGR